MGVLEHHVEMMIMHAVVARAGYNRGELRRMAERIVECHPEIMEPGVSKHQAIVEAELDKFDASRPRELRG